MATAGESKYTVPTNFAEMTAALTASHTDPKLGDWLSFRMINDTLLEALMNTTGKIYQMQADIRKPGAKWNARQLQEYIDLCLTVGYDGGSIGAELVAQHRKMFPLPKQEEDTPAPAPDPW